MTTTASIPTARPLPTQTSGSRVQQPAGSRRKGAIIAGAVAAALVVGGGIGVASYVASQQAAPAAPVAPVAVTVTVPNVDGLTYAEARVVLDEAGLVAAVADGGSLADTALVLEANPASGATAQEGGIVLLTTTTVDAG